MIMITRSDGIVPSDRDTLQQQFVRQGRGFL